MNETKIKLYGLQVSVEKKSTEAEEFMSKDVVRHLFSRRTRPQHERRKTYLEGRESYPSSGVLRPPADAERT